ncbi:MAG: M3 family metallopeptidase, partial [Kangiellaceae bacterium]|nr:M3 family metallopeptidase [Kangiellaceae bacterium]
MTITNPLLLQNPIEFIDKIESKHVEEAVSQVIEENKSIVESIVSMALEAPSDISWQNFMYPLELLEDRLGKVWSPVSHLNSVCNTAELREAYDGALALLTEYSTHLGQHKGLFDATNNLYQQKEQLKLSSTQVHILEDSLLAFKLSGLHLSKSDQEKYSQIQKRLAELSSKYEQNLLDSTMAWTKTCKEDSELAGLPETELAMLKANAETREVQGFVVTLEIPSYLAIMTYAENQALREEVYKAYTTRASDLADDPQFDNSKIMAELLLLKQQKAKLLGFDNYAQLSLKSKMAESPEQVVEFLMDLNSAARTQALQEYQELVEFAKDEGVDSLNAWDIAYFSEKLMQKSFQVSQSELRKYFTVDKVIAGLFKLTNHHFDVSFKEIETSSKWHNDVRHYAIKRNEVVIAEFYLDMYARPHKRGGAWMDDYQGRFKLDSHQVQSPIAYLTCNFAPPVNGQPALLTHDEVVTLFHEFGHGIHHMLTKVDELSASGIANVPWDAVELPSQFMENFCFQPEVLESLSEHFETG